MRISEAKCSPKRQKKKLSTQINGNFNGTAEENYKKYITVVPLFKNNKKTIFIDSILGSYTFFERNNAGLKNRSRVLSEGSSAFLNATCLLKYVLNCEQHFSFFGLDYSTSGLTVTGLSRFYCIYT
jgi:hypothetical protein